MEGQLPHMPTLYWVLGVVVVLFLLYHFVIRPQSQ